MTASASADTTIISNQKQCYPPSPTFLSRNAKILVDPSQLYSDNMSFPFREWMSLNYEKPQDRYNWKIAQSAEPDSTLQIDSIGYWIVDSLVVSGYYSKFPPQKNQITKGFVAQQDSIALSIDEIAQILHIRNPYKTIINTKSNREVLENWTLKRAHTNQLKAQSMLLYPNGDQTSFEVFYVLYFHRVIQDRIPLND